MFLFLEHSPNHCSIPLHLDRSEPNRRERLRRCRTHTPLLGFSLLLWLLVWCWYQRVEYLPVTKSRDRTSTDKLSWVNCALCVQFLSPNRRFCQNNHSVVLRIRLYDRASLGIRWSLSTNTYHHSNTHSIRSSKRRRSSGLADSHCSTPSSSLTSPAARWISWRMRSSCRAWTASKACPSSSIFLRILP